MTAEVEAVDAEKAAAGTMSGQVVSPADDVAIDSSVGMSVGNGVSGIFRVIPTINLVLG